MAVEAEYVRECRKMMQDEGIELTEIEMTIAKIIESNIDDMIYGITNGSKQNYLNKACMIFDKLSSVTFLLNLPYIPYERLSARKSVIELYVMQLYTRKGWKALFESPTLIHLEAPHIEEAKSETKQSNGTLHTKV